MAGLRRCQLRLPSSRTSTRPPPVETEPPRAPPACQPATERAPRAGAVSASMSACVCVSWAWICACWACQWAVESDASCSCWVREAMEARARLSSVLLLRQRRLQVAVLAPATARRWPPPPPTPPSSTAATPSARPPPPAPFPPPPLAPPASAPRPRAASLTRAGAPSRPPTRSRWRRAWTEDDVGLSSGQLCGPCLLQLCGDICVLRLPLCDVLQRPLQLAHLLLQLRLEALHLR